MARYTAAKSRPTYTFDADLEMKDTSAAIGADAAWQVAAAARVLDVGTGHFRGDCVIDVSALEIASGDERYTFLIQGSSSPTFASDIVILAALPVGDGSTIGTAFGSSGVDVDDTTGRYILPFTNERNNIYYRYIRGWTDVAGAIATGVTFTAFVGEAVNR
jgi:hypothetical protein